MNETEMQREFWEYKLTNLSLPYDARIELINLFNSNSFAHLENEERAEQMRIVLENVIQHMNENVRKVNDYIDILVEHILTI